MKLVKKALAGVALAVAVATPTFAAVQTIGGVTWDPASGLDFNMGSGAIFQTLGPVGSGGLVSGYGSISTINGSSSFCSGCELTFSFTGFTFLGQAGGPGLPFLPYTYTNYYTGGTLTFYRDTAQDFNLSNGATASNGTPWLVLNAVDQGFGVTFLGTASFSSPMTGNTLQQLGGSGVLEVVGGDPSAMAAINTNTQSFGGDMTFSTTFTNVSNMTYGLGDPDGVGPAPTMMLITGTSTGGGTVTGESVQIPEPGSIALLGLGLIGLAAARRRKA
jgi:hypothetical protein